LAVGRSHWQFGTLRVRMHSRPDHSYDDLQAVWDDAPLGLARALWPVVVAIAAAFHAGAHADADTLWLADRPVARLW
jgi:hypothetical protein